MRDRKLHKLLGVEDEAKWLAKILDSRYEIENGPWSWPGWGSVVPAFNPTLVAPVLSPPRHPPPPPHTPPPSAGAFATTFPGSVASPPSSSSADTRIGSAKHLLLPFFKPMPRPLSLVPPAGSAPLPLPPGLLSGPQVPQIPVSAVAPLVPSTASCQATATPSQATLAASQTMPNVQAWMQVLLDALLHSMKDKMLDMLGAAPPQPSMGPAVPPRIMGPDALRPLRPGDRALPWAPHQSGSKRADGSSRSRSPSGDRSLSSRDVRSRRRVHSLS